MADQIQRVRTGEQPLAGDLARQRGLLYRGRAVGAQQQLDGRLDRAARLAGLGDEPRVSVERRLRVRAPGRRVGLVDELMQDRRELGFSLSVTPADHCPDVSPAAGGGEQQRREALLGSRGPVIAAFDVATLDLTGARQPVRARERSIPRLSAVHRRPRAAPYPGELEGVDHEHVAELLSTGDRRVQQVGLDRGGDRDAIPLARPTPLPLRRIDDPDPRRSTFRGKIAGKSTTTQGGRSHPQRRLTNQRIPPPTRRYTTTSDLTDLLGPAGEIPAGYPAETVIAGSHSLPLATKPIRRPPIRGIRARSGQALASEPHTAE